MTAPRTLAQIAENRKKLEARRVKLLERQAAATKDLKDLDHELRVIATELADLEPTFVTLNAEEADARAQVALAKL
jgi:hypothetical protein